IDLLTPGVGPHHDSHADRRDENPCPRFDDAPPFSLERRSLVTTDRPQLNPAVPRGLSGELRRSVGMSLSAQSGHRPGEPSIAVISQDRSLAVPIPKIYCTSVDTAKCVGKNLRRVRQGPSNPSCPKEASHVLRRNPPARVRPGNGQYPQGA